MFYHEHVISCKQKDVYTFVQEHHVNDKYINKKNML